MVLLESKYLVRCLLMRLSRFMSIYFPCKVFERHAAVPAAGMSMTVWLTLLM
ncbi:Uncharacterised protein [Mycobacteroides abscessus subsp. abscessus]|nr:Uncharacterised protein [Mycobacteroides abscessus subsp. abscessus]